MKKIAYFLDGATGAEEITDAFISNHVGVIPCGIFEREVTLKKHTPDAVFTLDFSEETARLCMENGGIPYICWVRKRKAPELFSPMLFNRNNRVFFADHDLFMIFNSLGLTGIYHLGGNVCKISDKLHAGYAGQWDRIKMFLPIDELKYVQGLMKAQELFPMQPILFKGLSTDLVEKMYSYSGMEITDNILKKRYLIAECVLRESLAYTRVEEIPMSDSDIKFRVGQIVKIC